MRGDGRGNAGLWTRGKPNSRFSSAPTALGNRCAIPTFPPPRQAVEKWKAKSRLPTLPLHCDSPLSEQNKKGGLEAGSCAPRLQAHSSIRKCSTRRWVLGGSHAKQSDSAVQRQWISPRKRSVDLCRRHELGGPRPHVVATRNRRADGEAQVLTEQVPGGRPSKPKIRVPDIVSYAGAILRRSSHSCLPIDMATQLSRS
jgi:hypothetical protein